MDAADRIAEAKNTFVAAATQARDSDTESQEFMAASIEPMHGAALRYFEAVERALAESQAAGVGPGELLVLSLTRHSYVALNTYLKYWDALGRLSVRAGLDLQERYRPSPVGPRLLQAAIKVNEPAWAEELEREFRSRGLPVTGFEDRRITRILRAAWSPQQLAPQTPTILWLSANPEGTRHLAINKEIEQVRDRLPEGAAVAFQPYGALRITQLHDRLAEHEPRVVHFSGHGDGSDGIILEGDSGPVKLGADSLVDFFRSGPKSVRLVVLSACFSSEEAEALSGVIDCCVGMRGTILDKAAVAFNVRFYRAIVAHHLSVGEAAMQARVEMGALGYDKDADKVVVYGSASLRPFE